MIAASLPEQGQLVEVRRRRYVVAEVQGSQQPVGALAPEALRPQHMVTLASIEDDALGEELQVIWELEPGARVLDQQALPAPEGFDDPARLDAFLHAVRWGAASSADVRALQSPFRSGIAIEDYQLDPVVRAIQMPRANLLIADDVGLGKTIEAGLVAQELIIRHRARRILIICPSALQIQWRDQMREKFGLEFRIVDSELMRTLRRSRGIHVNPWGHFPRLITSIDYLKRDQPMRLFRETLPVGGHTYPRTYDLLIVDEAHNVAPSGVGRYAKDSLRTEAIRTLAPHFEHKLFLTATPHNGYAESFSSLLELLDNQRFARGVPPDRSVLRRVMVRRLKSELKVHWSGRALFPARELQHIEVAYAEAERAAHRQLQAYTALRQQDSQDAAERTATEFVLKLLKKRLLSSPAAFAATLEKHLASLEGAQHPERRAARRTPLGILRAMVADIEDAAGDGESDERLEEVVHTSSRLFRPTTAQEQALLDALRTWAEGARRRPDAKARTLLDWLGQIVRPGGAWSDERVIIFTEYRDTQNWLFDLLAAEGLTASGRTMRLSGGMADDERERVKAAFQASPDESAVRILLATDAASEGIDLQRHCYRLVHYEIPWNPNRMEQRNGRIDRHGQQHNPQIFHFAPQGFDAASIRPDVAVGQLEGDLEFLMRAVQKVEQIREDLGKVGPVIADQVTDAMLGRRQRLDTAQAERDAEPTRRMLVFERKLDDQIRKLYEQLQESRHTLQLTPEHVQAVVEIALDLAGQPPLREAALPGVWPDPGGARRRCPVFHLPPLQGSWAACAEGLEHPHTRALRPIVFDHELAKGRDDVVLAHLNHRLVQMALRLLRAEVWNTASHQRHLHRVAARTIPDHLASAPLALIYGRLVVIGGDSARLHEEIIVAGGEIQQGRLRRLNVGQVQETLDAMGDAQPAPAVRDDLARAWPAVADAARAALDARAEDRAASLLRLLAERRAKEAADIQQVLDELDRAIRAELDDEHRPVQLALDLFNESEREQYRRDIDALEARLAQIPAERAQETEAIERRYAGIQHRLFPLAVVFLVPRRMA
ncbi:helicase [Chloroflexia bacterium SDU3-3]|nr:helicase [Chloroflexia bacterium SDU3-3]